ncbi:DUF1772 domain-containing protein [Rhodococcus maanshanensis]|uniref:anthrone oxygenase family protein n=1 Tax=Rhodococcus maanshanensis TaxID=183556 RepID=UPI0022B49535|nr:anthrone oxygenase family protein [Rhodococcus maanshanensis]MCZ4556898.1 DUF1772 domain-containing protein [Rhodococcus maanshanensis]
MNTKLLQTITLLGAGVTAGLMAGLFAAFAYAVMPGLGRTGDQTFISAMQKINVAILNGWFMICFLGGLVLTVVTLLLHLRSARGALPWIIAALVFYIAMLVITAAVNVPLNDELARAGDVIANPDVVREQFESRWVTWNIVRAVVSTAAFAALAYALVVHGRETAPQAQPTAAAAAPAAAAPEVRPTWMYPAEQIGNGNGGNRSLPSVTDGR